MRRTGQSQVIDFVGISCWRWPKTRSYPGKLHQEQRDTIKEEVGSICVKILAFRLIIEAGC
jgi:hypothetical protein